LWYPDLSNRPDATAASLQLQEFHSTRTSDDFTRIKKPRGKIQFAFLTFSDETDTIELKAVVGESISW
jgi:hypothetical protein